MAPRRILMQIDISDHRRNFYSVFRTEHLPRLQIRLPTAASHLQHYIVDGLTLQPQEIKTGQNAKVEQRPNPA